MLAVPPVVWEAQVAKARRRIEAGLGFMTPAHRAVHHFAVRELPRHGRPLSPEVIAHGVNLNRAQVVALLDDLEARMTFLFRNPAGEVLWAYPVTAAPTPHAIAFDSGENLFAA
jgi:hypothetical protein